MPRRSAAAGPLHRSLGLSDDQVRRIYRIFEQLLRAGEATIGQGWARAAHHCQQAEPSQPQPKTEHVRAG